MRDITRRDIFKLGAVGAAVLATGKTFGSRALAGNMIEGGKDFSPKTGVERTMMPSACWNCVTRDAMIGYVEDGRLVKLEGQPNSIRGRGKICSKGAAKSVASYCTCSRSSVAITLVLATASRSNSRRYS